MEEKRRQGLALLLGVGVDRPLFWAGVGALLGVRVGPSGRGWPFLLGVGVGPSGWGWPFLLGVRIGQLCVGIIVIIVTIV